MVAHLAFVAYESVGLCLAAPVVSVKKCLLEVFT